jgi:hypothetical protein
VRLETSATFECAHCGEPCTVPVDPLAGSVQEYVEDCHVCCNPNQVRVHVTEDGAVSAEARAE